MGVLHDSTENLLVLRPLGGTDREIAGVYLPLEGADIKPARFDLPDPARPGDFLSCRLLRDAVRLGFRASAGPFRSFARINVEPQPYQLVSLLMALKLDPVRLLTADDVGICQDDRTSAHPVEHRPEPSAFSPRQPFDPGPPHQTVNVLPREVGAVVKIIKTGRRLHCAGYPQPIAVRIDRKPARLHQQITLHRSHLSLDGHCLCLQTIEGAHITHIGMPTTTPSTVAQTASSSSPL